MIETQPESEKTQPDPQRRLLLIAGIGALTFSLFGLIGLKEFNNRKNVVISMVEQQLLWHRDNKATITKLETGPGSNWYHFPQSYKSMAINYGKNSIQVCFLESSREDGMPEIYFVCRRNNSDFLRLQQTIDDALMSEPSTPAKRAPVQPGKLA